MPHTFNGNFTEDEKEFLNSRVDSKTDNWVFYNFTDLENGGYHCFNKTWPQVYTRIYGRTLDDMMANLILRIIV